MDDEARGIDRLELDPEPGPGEVRAQRAVDRPGLGIELKSVDAARFVVHERGRCT